MTATTVKVLPVRADVELCVGVVGEMIRCVAWFDLVTASDIVHQK